MSNLLRRLLLIFAVVISGALCTVEDYVIMSQCAHNKAIHLAAEGTVSVTDISQTQNITILGLPDFVNNSFKIALYSKETQRYLCFSENWRLVALKELQNTCYFNETIVHGYFVFRSVVDLQRRIGFTHRGKAVGPKKNVNDACYLFTKIQADEFFNQHSSHFAHKITTATTATTTTTTTVMSTSTTLSTSRFKMQRNKNKRRNNNNNNKNNNSSISNNNNNQNQQQLNGHNSNISSNLSSNKQQQQQKLQNQQNQKLELEKEKGTDKDRDKGKEKERQHYKNYHHHQHHHHQKHQHQVRHHHNNPDIIARRQQHEQKLKRKPHNRLHMVSTTTTSTVANPLSTRESAVSKISHSDASTIVSKVTQTAFETSTLPTTPIQRLITSMTTTTPKATYTNSKLLTKILSPASRSTSTTMTTTITTTKRKGRRRKHKKNTHKQQKLQQPTSLSRHHVDDQNNILATEENERASSSSSSSLDTTSWSDFTSMASFFDEASPYYGNDWFSSSAEGFSVSPTSSLSTSDEYLSTKSTQGDYEPTSLFSQTPTDESTNVAYTTHSINNRKKSQLLTTVTSKTDTWSPVVLYDGIKSTINGLLTIPDPTNALPKHKSKTSHQSKRISKNPDVATTTVATWIFNEMTANSFEPITTNITTTTRPLSTTTINKIVDDRNTNEYIESTTMQHEATPTQMSNTINDINFNKWLASLKGNSSHVYINRNISKHSMTEFLNSTRSSNIHSNDNGSFAKNQNFSTNSTIDGKQHQHQTQTPISLSDKISNSTTYFDHNATLSTFINTNTLATLTSTSTSMSTSTSTTKNTIINKSLEKTKFVEKPTTLSPLLQLFSPNFPSKDNILMTVEKNINNGHINNSLLDEKTFTTSTTPKATKVFTTQPTLLNSPKFISTSTIPSTRKTIRKSTQKLLATPFHQLTTYVRNEAGDIDIDNIDNISVYSDLIDSESLNDGVAQLKNHQQYSNSNSTNSRLIVVSGYLPTSASAILPESIQIAKIKINKERQRLWPQRPIGSSA